MKFNQYYFLLFFILLFLPYLKIHYHHFKMIKLNLFLIIFQIFSLFQFILIFHVFPFIFQYQIFVYFIFVNFIILYFLSIIFFIHYSFYFIRQFNLEVFNFLIQKSLNFYYLNQLISINVLINSNFYFLIDFQFEFFFSHFHLINLQVFIISKDHLLIFIDQKHLINNQLNFHLIRLYHLLLYFLFCMTFLNLNINSIKLVIEMYYFYYIFFFIPFSIYMNLNI